MQEEREVAASLTVAAALPVRVLLLAVLLGVKEEALVPVHVFVNAVVLPL
jgi:hypothetical protein